MYIYGSISVARRLGSWSCHGSEVLPAEGGDACLGASCRSSTDMVPFIRQGFPHANGVRGDLDPGDLGSVVSSYACFFRGDASWRADIQLLLLVSSASPQSHLEAQSLDLASA
jgi:hypothetical protein